MRFTIGAIISIFILLSFDVSGQRCANKTAYVILVAGQSNANGTNSAITELTTGMDTKLNSCKVWNGSAFEYLYPIAQNNNQMPASSENGSFAFPVPLVSNLYDSTQQNIYLINYAIGGTKMYNNASPSVWTSAISTSLYNDFRIWAKNGLSAISAIEDNYEVLFYFYQGETDCTNATWADAYEVNLGNFIDSVRNYLLMPTMNTYIMRIHSGSSPTYTELATVRAAQAAVAAAKINVTMVSTDDCTLGADLQHLTSAGHITLANKLSGLISKKKLIIYRQ